MTEDPLSSTGSGDTPDARSSVGPASPELGEALDPAALTPPVLDTADAKSTVGPASPDVGEALDPAAQTTPAPAEAGPAEAEAPILEGPSSWSEQTPPLEAQDPIAEGPGGYAGRTWSEAPPSSAPPAFPPPAAPRRGRPVLTAAAAGAVAGALVGGVLVGLWRSDAPTTPRPSVTFSRNTSKIALPVDIQEILSRVQPAVVAIRTRTLELGDFFRPVPRGEGAGTGFVISDDGVIVTNNHVLSGARSIEVVFDDDRKLAARVLGRDPTTDLAVLKVDATGLSAATLGNSDELQVGDDVLAIGNALALEGGPTVTRGIVSAKDRTIEAEASVRLEHVIQTDAAINPGNSGGPLVNSSGEVVGINTAVAGEAQNIGFSIAITEAKPILEDLRQGTTRPRPLLGVSMVEVTPALVEELGLGIEKGALVAEVAPGSGAEAGGIRRLDVIVEIDGKAVENPADVTGAVRSHKPGDELGVTVVRERQRQTFKVRLGERSVDLG